MHALEHLDVLIVGAGLSGIDAAYWLKTKSPERTWTIFEARDAIGGTWDLFRYPGVRSDSDMSTLGFPFRPWRGAKAIVDGPDIRDYIRDTAREYGIDSKIRMGHRVTGADWSSIDARWTISFEAGSESRQITCSFLYLCSGYYDYTEGYAPTWPGMETFKGQIVHPQFWPDDLVLQGKTIVVIGSGATAVTLVPALLKKGAAHVTMLQRSPTYIVSMPSHDRKGAWLRRLLPAKAADTAIRWKDIGYGIFVYGASRRTPEAVKRKIAERQRRVLGPDFDIDRHLTPRYDPWDQRLCLVPDGDLFDVLKGGQATIVTDQIAGFMPDCLRLGSGDVLTADIVVTATGLKMKLMGGATIRVDGTEIDPGTRLLYKGAMLEGVPNCAFAIGYTNASWTLKCDLTSQFVSKLLNHMAKQEQVSVTPIAPTDAVADEPMLDLSSGYVQRAHALLPRQGSKPPWRVHQNYVSDLLAFHTGRIDDPALQFAGRSSGNMDVAA